MNASDMMSERELLVRIDERQARMQQDFADLVRSTKESIETIRTDVERRFEIQQGRCESHGKDIRELKTERDQATGKRKVLYFILPAFGAILAIVFEYGIKLIFHI